jgi:putative tryptophan/tyrosine transport system substrate-binding protein
VRRRDAVLSLLAWAAAPCAGFAQRARRPRIGYLLLSPVTDAPSRERQAFLDGLRELGYVPGKTVEIVYRSAENEPAFIDEIARDLVKLGVDVIATSGAAATLSAKRATRDVPIVMLALGDPVGVGAVTSLARPGGNVTGVSFISSDLAPKRVQLIKELVPQARRIAIVWDTRNANARNEAAATVAAARTLDMLPESLGMASDTELAGALEALAARRTDVLYAAFEGGLIASNRTLLAEFGLRHRLPVVSGWSFLSEAGGLMSYAPDIPAMFYRAAFYVHRVLQGEKPESLPIELPTRVELVINLKTAMMLGIVVPRSILLRADRVIE